MQSNFCKAHGRKWCAPIARFLKWGQYLRGIPVFVFESPSVPLPSRFISSNQMSLRIQLILHMRDDELLFGKVR